MFKIDKELIILKSSKCNNFERKKRFKKASIRD